MKLVHARPTPDEDGVSRHPCGARSLRPVDVSPSESISTSWSIEPEGMTCGTCKRIARERAHDE